MQSIIIYSPYKYKNTINSINKLANSNAKQYLLLLSDKLLIKKLPDLNEYDGTYLLPETKYRKTVDVFKLMNEYNLKHYYNADVVICNKDTLPLFIKYIKKEIDLLELNILLKDKDIKPLSYMYNYLHYMEGQTGYTRLMANIINYAEAPEPVYKTLFVQDSNEITKNIIPKRDIVIKLAGGIGDQFCNYAVAKYIKLYEYPDDNIILVTHFPELFKDLLKHNISVVSYDEYIKQSHYLELYAVPDEGQGNHLLSHVMFHPIDYGTISTIRKTIPNYLKKLEYTIDINNVIEFTENYDINIIKKSILIHASKWWDSKTYPTEWWQEVIDLLQKDYNIILIGKETEHQGLLNININNEHWDLRNKTNIDELALLIANSPVLISNDSFPIHLAGAFDNWIVTFATAKAPEHILPFRNNTQEYKTLSLEKRLLLKDLKVNFLDENIDTIDTFPKNHTWDEYLPSPLFVYNRIKEIYKEN